MPSDWSCGTPRPVTSPWNVSTPSSGTTCFARSSSTSWPACEVTSARWWICARRPAVSGWHWPPRRRSVRGRSSPQPSRARSVHELPATGRSMSRSFLSHRGSGCAPKGRGDAMNLSIVMYHYVRELRCSRFPNINGLETDQFREQIAYIKKHYTVISGAELLAAADAHALGTLPRAAALLTFDDGYLDHFTQVFPILQREKLAGCFFPPGNCTLE